MLISVFVESAVVTGGSGCKSAKLHNLNGTLQSKTGESLIGPCSVVFESDGEASFTSDEFDVSRTTVFKDPAQLKNPVFKGGLYRQAVPN